MKRSLSLKMLLLTLGSSLVLILAVLGSLYAYFSLFYTPVKIARTVRAINQFAQSYESGTLSPEQLYVAAYRFMKQENVYLGINNGSPVDSGYGGFVITTADALVGEAVPAIGADTASGSTGSDEGAASAPEAQPVAPTTTSGSMVFSVPGNAVLIQELTGGDSVPPGFDQAGSNDVTMRMEDGTTYAVRRVDSADLFGMVTSTQIDGVEMIFALGEVDSFGTSVPAEVMPQAEVARASDGVQYTVSVMPFTNTKEAYFWREARLPDGTRKTLSVYLSLQPVEDVANVFLLFLPFVLLLAILLSLLGAFVHDRTVVRPILCISEAATRMAAMERDVVSTVDTGDELGILSRSINTMSGNLRRALDDLTTANTQLVEDVRQKTHQEQVRKEFVANVSHELKTPLAVVKSYAEGLADGVRAEKRDHYTAVILEEVERMDGLVREMLEISRLDAGAVRFNKQVVDAGEMVEQAVSAIAPIAEARRMRMDVNGAWGPVLADASRIGRVLDNLIGNAVRHGKEDTVVRVSGLPVKRGVEIAVENVCDPIPPEQMAMIWDRFYKGDTSHSRSAEGAGLGLAIVRSILEGHGCPYGVENTETGVRFFFTLDKA